MDCLVIASASGYAAVKDVTGKVGIIRYHIDDSDMTTAWRKVIWFEVKDPSMPFCHVNRISILPGNEEALSILLSAKMTDNEIMVRVDESKTYPDSKYCKLQFITLL